MIESEFTRTRAHSPDHLPPYMSFGRFLMLMETIATMRTELGAYATDPANTPNVASRLETGHINTLHNLQDTEEELSSLYPANTQRYLQLLEARQAAQPEAA